MCSIFLIATGHAENGLCNLDELFKIIEAIEPEIIFEEIPPSKFSAVYAGLPINSLEVLTIQRYLQRHSIPHVPVDMEIDEQTGIFLRQAFGQLTDMIAYYCPEYDALNYKQRSNATLKGFPYLNSDEWGALSDRIHFLEKEILRKLNNSEHSKTYNEWLNILDGRENEMIKNIYSYSEHTKYERALFLVGAEHKKPIIEKIPEFEKSAKQKINWVFNYFDK